jgi:hypothetical protein
MWFFFVCEQDKKNKLEKAGFYTAGLPGLDGKCVLLCGRYLELHE